MPTADPFRYFLADFTRSSDEPRHIHPFSIVLFRFGNRCRPHLVDATSVEINDFEPPTIPCVQSSPAESKPDPAHRRDSGMTGASSTPRRSRPSLLSPGAGHLFNSE